MSDCPHAANGNCRLSTTLAGIAVPLDAKACEVCQLADRPRDMNGVVCSRAVWALRKAEREVPPEIFRCIHENQQDGPGSELKALLSFWAEPSDTCKCNARMAMMNGWGINGCKRNFSLIVGWIHGEALERYPLLAFVPCRWYFKRLVKRAILNASRKSIRNQSQHPARPAQQFQRPIAQA